MRSFFSVTSVLAAAMLMAGFSYADDAQKEGREVTKPKASPETPDVEIIHLTVYPAALPRPVLKYRLLPIYLDKMPGNAALLYHRSILEIEGTIDRMDLGKTNEDTIEKIDSWMHAPIKELPQKEIRSILNQLPLKEVKSASRRMDCDWGFPIRETDDPFSVTLNELQRSRQLARIIALNARMQIAQNDPRTALDYLQMGYVLSRHVGQSPFFVGVAIGDAIADTMSEQMLDLCQLKDAPNLYWSLTILPHPLVDAGKAVDYESVCIPLQFKELLESQNGSHSPEQWQEIWIKFVNKFNDIGLNVIRAEDRPAKIDPHRMLKDKYPFVCEQMKSRGWDDKSIESKAPAQLMLIYCDELFNEIRDEELKWTGVPCFQLPADHLNKENRLFQHYKEIEIVPLSQLIVFLRTFQGRQTKTEQLLAVLRCIESLRLYAASHNGNLPENLSEIGVPVPLDPFTNQAIAYHTKDGMGVVAIKYPTFQTIDSYSWASREYHIKILK